MTRKRSGQGGYRSKQVQAGFSLLETLVAILIVSIGVLGTSGLLIKGMSSAKTSSLRATAAMQASSLAAALYSNRTFWAAHDSAISFTSSGASLVSSSTNIDTSKTSCSSCTPAQLAGLDVSTWVNSLNNALPDAKSDVSCPQVTSNSARNCTIKISWSERFIESDKNAGAASVATTGERSYFLHIEP